MENADRETLEQLADFVVGIQPKCATEAGKDVEGRVLKMLADCYDEIQKTLKQEFK